MQSILDNALTDVAANRSIAETASRQMIKSGASFSSVFSNDPGLSQLNSMRSSSRNRKTYEQYAGWVHSAVSALAMYASDADVILARITGAKSSNTYREKDAKDGKPNRKRILSEGYRKRMPRRMREKSAREEYEMVLDHPLLDTMEKPNAFQSRNSFVNMFVTNLCLTGWGFVIYGHNKTTGLAEFYALPTTWVKPIHDKGPFAEFKIVNPNNPAASEGQAPIPGNQVGFAHFPNPGDPFSAIAPAGAQSRAISIDDKIQSSQEVFFHNGIFPSVVLSIGTNPFGDKMPGDGTRPLLDDKQRRQVIGAINKVHAGVANYGHPAIIDGLIEKIEKMSMTQNEMGWEKSEKIVRSRILSAFGVHPFILGEEMPGSYAQAYEVRQLFYDRVNKFLDALSTIVSTMVNEFSEEPIELYWERLVPVDPMMDAKKYSDARKNNDISQNEYRAWMGLPPDDDRNEAIVNHPMVMQITGILKMVADRSMVVDQAVALLEAMGLPTDKAEKIVGDGPPEPEPVPDEFGEGDDDQGDDSEDINDQGDDSEDINDQDSKSIDRLIEAMKQPIEFSFPKI